MYFIASAKYDKMQENGLVKTVTEQYLLDSLSFTEAESRAIEELTPFLSGEFSIDAVKKTKVSELFLTDGADKFFKVKIAFITIDERTCVEKKSVSTIIVQANDFDEAYQRFKEEMRGTVADFDILSISETSILEYFPVKSCEVQK